MRLPFVSIPAMSDRHASARAHERYRGKAKDRRYEGVSVSASSGNEKLVGGFFDGEEEYGGGSRAENAGVRMLSVHALSGVGSSWFVRASYA